MLTYGTDLDFIAIPLVFFCICITFYELCKKLELGHFSVFALAAAILSSQ